MAETNRRAELEERIARARKCIEAANVADRYRMTAVATLRARALAKGLDSKRGRKATARADHIDAMLARDAAEVRTPANALIQILQTELDAMTEGKS